MKNKFSWNDILRVERCVEQLHQRRKFKLFMALAHQVGVNELERLVGIVREDKNIRDPIAYLIKLCK